jgi:hypothetical protein
MMEKYQRTPYNGALRETGRGKDQKYLQKIGYQRRGEKLE